MTGARPQEARAVFPRTLANLMGLPTSAEGRAAGILELVTIHYTMYINMTNMCYSLGTLRCSACKCCVIIYIATRVRVYMMVLFFIALLLISIAI